MEVSTSICMCVGQEHNIVCALSECHVSHCVCVCIGKWLEEVVPTVSPRLFQCSNASGRFNVEEIFDFAQDVSHHITLYTYTGSTMYVYGGSFFSFSHCSSCCCYDVFPTSLSPLLFSPLFPPPPLSLMF